MSRAWARWIAFWDEREDPLSLAWVRVACGLVWAADFAYIWALDLVVPLFGVTEIGGFSDALKRDETPWFYLLFPGTELSARLLHAAMLLLSLCVAAGFFTRASSAALLFAWSAFVGVNGYADRGIDSLARLVLLIFVFSPAGKALSIDALRTTGSIWGDGRTEPAMARRLLILQLVFMYFVAALCKVGVTWWPMGNFAALYFALRDPAVAAWDFTWLRHPVGFFFTQVGTASTVAFQVTYPVVLLFWYWRRHPEGRGAFARWALRWRVEWLWIGTGALFHVLLALTMTLGIFPWGLLALYPVWFEPEEITLAGRRLRGWLFPSAP